MAVKAVYYHCSCTQCLNAHDTRLSSSEPFRRTFKLCDTSSLEDESARIAFAGDGVVVLPIQENDPACGGTVCNIKAVCKIMTDDEKGSEARVVLCCVVWRCGAGRDL